MSVIKVSGNTGGTGIFHLRAPNSSTDRFVTLPDKAGDIAVGAGTIVQVVHASTTTETSTTSSTYTDTALSASITPTSSSNKIMVHVVANMGWSNGGSGNSWAGGVRLLRDSTVIDTPNDDNGPISFYTGIFGVSGLSTGISRGQQPFLAFDSPATTSSVTYKAQIASRGGAQIQLCVPGNNLNGTSHIFLMEVVA